LGAAGSAAGMVMSVVVVIRRCGSGLIGILMRGGIVGSRSSSGIRMWSWRMMFWMVCRIPGGWVGSSAS